LALPEASRLAPDSAAFAKVFKVLSRYFGESPVVYENSSVMIDHES